MADIVFHTEVDPQGVASGMKAAQDEVKRGTKQIVDDWEKSFQTLKIKSDQTYKGMGDDVMKALNIIKTSSKSTTEDIARATRAAEQQLAAMKTAAAGGAEGFNILGSAGSVAGAVLNQFGQAGSMASTLMAGLTSTTGLLAAGIGVLGYAVHSLIGNLVSTVTQMQQLQYMAGGTITQLSKLMDAITLMGVDADNLSRVFFRLGSEIEQGGKGLAKYGIEVKDAFGNLKEPVDVLLELRSAMSQIGDTAERNAALTELFSARIARGLIPVFAQSEEAFQDAMSRATGISEEHAKAALEYKKNVAAIQVAWNSLKVELAGPIVAQVNVFLKWMTGDGKPVTKRSILEMVGDLFDPSKWAAALGPTPAPKEAQGLSTKETEAGKKQWAAEMDEVVDKAAQRVKKAEEEVQVLRAAVERALAETGKLSAAAVEMRANAYQAAFAKFQQGIAEELAADQKAAAAGKMTAEQLTAAKISMAQREVTETIKLQNKLYADKKAMGFATPADEQKAEEARLAAIRAAQNKRLALGAEEAAGRLKLVQAGIALEAAQRDAAMKHELAVYEMGVTREQALREMATSNEIKELDRTEQAVKSAMGRGLLTQEQGLEQQMALIEARRDAELRSIEDTTAATIAAAKERERITERELRMQLAALPGKGLDPSAEALERQRINAQIQANYDASQAAQYKAATDRIVKTNAAEQGARDRAIAMTKAEQDAITAIYAESTAGRIRAIDNQLAAIAKALDDPRTDQATREALVTKQYELELSRRVLAQQNATDVMMASWEKATQDEINLIQKRVDAEQVANEKISALQMARAASAQQTADYIGAAYANALSKLPSQWKQYGDMIDEAVKDLVPLPDFKKFEQAFGEWAVVSGRSMEEITALWLKIQSNYVTKAEQKWEENTDKAAEQYARLTTAYDSEENKRLRSLSKFIDEEKSKREELIDAAIKVYVEINAGIDKEMAKWLAIEAGGIKAVLAERQKLIDDQNTLNQKQELLWQQNLDAWSVQTRATGDYFGFFNAELGKAMTAGKGFYDSLRTFAQQAASAMQQTFSDLFFNVMEGKFDDLKSVAQSFMTSVKRAFADFLSNTVVNQLGRMFGGVGTSVTEASQSVAAAFTQGVVPASDAVVTSFNQLAQAAYQAAMSMPGGVNQSFGAPTPVALPSSLISPRGMNVNIGGINPSTLSSLWEGAKGLWGAVSGGWTSGEGFFGGVTEAIKAGWSWLTSSTTSAITMGPAGATMGWGASTLQGATGSLTSGLNKLGSALGPATSAMAAFSAVTAAVGIALTAMRSDISDTGKAISTSLQAVGTALLIAGEPIGKVVGAALLVVNWLLDMFGVFGGPSEDWIKFPEHLQETLGKEQEALQGFVKDLKAKTNLEGVAQSIKKFIDDINAFIPDFAKRPEVEGLGPFQVPGIPGATGTEHEGGITYDFGPDIQKIQDAINTVLRDTREIISVKLVQAARDALPPALADAVVEGLGKMRQEFDALVVSADATIEDVAAFEARLKSMGAIISGIAAEAGALNLLNKAMKLALPADMFTAFKRASLDPLNQSLVDLAKSGTATVEQLEAVKVQIEATAKIGEQLGVGAQSLKTLGTTAATVLPGDLAAGVAAHAATLRQSLLDLANSSKITAEKVNEVTADIAALSTGVTLFLTLSGEIASLSGDFRVMTDYAKELAQTQIKTAAQAIEDAQTMLADAITGPELAAAATQLEAAIMSKYQLEMKLLAEVEAQIDSLLDTFGASLLKNAQYAANYALSVGNIEPFKGLLYGLQGVAAAADSATLKLWAAKSALAAIIAAIPSAIEGYGAAIPPQHVNLITESIYQAALPSLTTMANLYADALNAGNLQMALDLLGQGSAAILDLANAAIAGIEQWRDAAIEAATEAEAAMEASITKEAQKQIDAIRKSSDEEIKAIQDSTQAEIDGINEATQASIDGINAKLEADLAANDLAIEGLNAQKDAINEAIQLSREWAQAVESLAKYIKDLQLGTMAPPNPLAQMQLAERFYREALAQYQAGPTPEGLGAVQQAAQDYLQSLQGVYTRPDPKYAEIFNAVLDQLKALQADAEARITPEQQMLAELESIDAQIEALNNASDALRDAAEAQIDALQSAADAQIEALQTAADQQLTALEDARDQQIAAIETARDAQITALQAGLETTIQGINDAADGQVAGIKAAVAEVEGQIAAKQFELLGQLIGQQVEIEKAITGGLTPLQYQLVAARNTLDALTNLRDIVRAALMGQPIPEANVPVTTIVTPPVEPQPANPEQAPPEPTKPEEHAGQAFNQMTNSWEDIPYASKPDWMIDPVWDTTKQAWVEREDAAPYPYASAQYGGVFTRPTRVLLGEAGAEAVVPLGENAGLGHVFNITINGEGLDPKEIVDELERRVSDKLDQRVEWSLRAGVGRRVIERTKWAGRR